MVQLCIYYLTEVIKYLEKEHSCTSEETEAQRDLGDLSI